MWRIDGRDASTRVRLIAQAAISIQTFDPTGHVPWLWRGQADETHGLVPALHTAMLRNNVALEDSEVVRCTEEVIRRARQLRLDRHESTRLPDMALLARLQHYGVATPLLDVTVDPIVALYMAVVPSPGIDLRKEAGKLFGLPHFLDMRATHSSFSADAREHLRHRGQIDAYDDRPFSDIYREVVGYAASSKPANGCPLMFYSAPSVTDRLAIQRGYFVIGAVSSSYDVRTTTLEGVVFDDVWIDPFLKSVGKVGKPPNNARPSNPAALIELRVNGGQTRKRLRQWIEPRSGLTPESIYPPAWHEPHLEAWARRNGRWTLVL